MICFPKRSLNAPQPLGGLFDQDARLEAREGLLARGLARVWADKLWIIALARVLRTVHDAVTMPRLGPVVAPVQRELSNGRNRTAVSVGLTSGLGTIERARLVTLIRITSLIATTRARAVVARARVFGDPTHTVAALVRAVLGTAACVLVLRRGARTVAARYGTVARTGIGGLGRTADLIPARCGTVAAAVSRVLGLTTVTIAALLGAVGHALLAGFALRRITDTVPTLRGADATVRRTRITGLDRLVAVTVPALRAGRRAAVVGHVIAVVVETVAADIGLGTRCVARSPSPSEALLTTRGARDHAQSLDAFIDLTVAVVVLVVARFLVLLPRPTRVDLLAVATLPLAGGLAATLAALRGRGLVPLVRLAIAVIVDVVAIAVEPAVSSLARSRLAGHRTLAGAEDQGQHDKNDDLKNLLHKTPSNATQLRLSSAIIMQLGCICQGSTVHNS